MNFQAMCDYLTEQREDAHSAKNNKLGNAINTLLTNVRLKGAASWRDAIFESLHHYYATLDPFRKRQNSNFFKFLYQLISEHKLELDQSRYYKTFSNKLKKLDKEARLLFIDWDTNNSEFEVFVLLNNSVWDLRGDPNKLLGQVNQIIKQKGSNFSTPRSSRSTSVSEGQSSSAPSSVDDDFWENPEYKRLKQRVIEVIDEKRNLEERAKKNLEETKRNFAIKEKSLETQIQALTQQLTEAQTKGGRVDDLQVQLTKLISEKDTLVETQESAINALEEKHDRAVDEQKKRFEELLKVAEDKTKLAETSAAESTLAVTKIEEALGQERRQFAKDKQEFEKRILAQTQQLTEAQTKEARVDDLQDQLTKLISEQDTLVENQEAAINALEEKHDRAVDEQKKRFEELLKIAEDKTKLAASAAESTLEVTKIKETFEQERRQFAKDKQEFEKRILAQTQQLTEAQTKGARVDDLQDQLTKLISEQDTLVENQEAAINALEEKHSRAVDEQKKRFEELLKIAEDKTKLAETSAAESTLEVTKIKETFEQERLQFAKDKQEFENRILAQTQQLTEAQTKGARVDDLQDQLTKIQRERDPQITLVHLEKQKSTPAGPTAEKATSTNTHNLFTSSQESSSRNIPLISKNHSEETISMQERIERVPSPIQFNPSQSAGLAFVPTTPSFTKGDPIETFIEQHQWFRDTLSRHDTQGSISNGWEVLTNIYELIGLQVGVSDESQPDFEDESSQAFNPHQLHEKLKLLTYKDLNDLCTLLKYCDRLIINPAAPGFSPEQMTALAKELSKKSSSAWKKLGIGLMVFAAIAIVAIAFAALYPLAGTTALFVGIGLVCAKLGATTIPLLVIANSLVGALSATGILGFGLFQWGAAKRPRSNLARNVDKFIEESKFFPKPAGGDSVDGAFSHEDEEEDRQSIANSAL